MSDLFSDYLRRLSEIDERGNAREESFYPCLVDLLARYAEHAGRSGIHVTTVPRRTERCLLDFQVWHGRHRIVGYVEAKRPGANLDAAETSEQVERYKQTFPNLILTNFLELRLYRQGKPAARADVRREPDALALLDLFFDFEAPRRHGAASLAAGLARRARLLESRIEDLLGRDRGLEEPSDLTLFHRAFSTYLRAGLSERQFADIYAQTVACGLLAARARSDETGAFERASIRDSIPSSSGVLREVFRYISLSPPPEIEWIVDDLVDFLRPAPVREILSRLHAASGKDPILHFYETFLQQYDPELRRRRGVFYTPRPVVSYLVRSVDALLRTRLGRPDGLADPGVTLLDPAAGTMTFVVEAFRLAIETHAAAYGEAGVTALLRDHLIPHFFGFELMMAPYAIGHLKMSLFLEENGYRLDSSESSERSERINLLLTNALENEEGEQRDLPGMSSLARESRRAGRIKQEQPITVVLGNPPWSGFSANQTPESARWLREGQWPGDEGYYRVDGRPLGEKNPKWLQDDYVKFLRAAQRWIHQNGQDEGILAFVTNHGWLDNPTFRGMRSSLLQSFDEVYVLDLHGNRRKKERAPGDGVDENVFEGIRQGAAIVLLVRKPGLPKRILRADLWGNRKHKHRWLEARDVESTSWTEIRPRAAHSPLVERDAPLEEEYVRGIPVPEIFPLGSAGVLTARDQYVIGFDRAALRRWAACFRKGLLPGEMVPKDYPRDTESWKVADAVKRAAADARWEERFIEILWRPFDLRQIFYADYLVERPRDRVMRHLLAGPNLGLVLPRRSQDGAGALVTDRIAAHKAVSAYDINFVFPLYLYPKGSLALDGGRSPNVAPALLRFLERSHGIARQPEEILGYVYAVLHSETYRERYAGFSESGLSAHSLCPRPPPLRRPRRARDRADRAASHALRLEADAGGRLPGEGERQGRPARPPVGGLPARGAPGLYQRRGAVLRRHLRARVGAARRRLPGAGELVAGARGTEAQPARDRGLLPDRDRPPAYAGHSAPDRRDLRPGRLAGGGAVGRGVRAYRRPGRRSGLAFHGSCGQACLG